MLSFDITDRNIRIIKGAESGGKIKISKAATLNLEEEVIINGHVKDIPRVATLINGILKKSGMADKEAIVSISSNLTIFKELQVPRAKEQEFAKMVRQEMLSSAVQRIMVRTAKLWSRFLLLHVLLKWLNAIKKYSRCSAFH